MGLQVGLWGCRRICGAAGGSVGLRGVMGSQRPPAATQWHCRLFVQLYGIYGGLWGCRWICGAAGRSMGL